MFYVSLSGLSVPPTFQDISSLSQAFTQEAMGRPSSGIAQPGHMTSLMRGGMCVGWLYDGRRPRIEPWGDLATLLRFSIPRKG